LLQHHGAPTRMVDFTLSILVAAYFTVSPDISGDGAIWAVDIRHLLRLIAGREDHAPSLLEEIENARLTAFLNQRILLRQVTPMQFESNYWGGRLVGVVPAEPTVSNYRLARQQGLFLVPINVNKSFVANLLHAFRIGEDLALDPFQLDIDDLHTEIDAIVEVDELGPLPVRPVIKIVLPERERRPLAKALLRMGLTAEALFPGVDGLARGVFEPIYANSEMPVAVAHRGGA